ncbi:hypothetical protein M426DRAFT_325064 [Hypoxylon sp. CI-4A]|nr:hypothetical protein M426DRAFT_325064 [Hypoxylon sp. CI-4A]
MTLQFTTFDVFTSRPFRGNPLAIVEVPTSTTSTTTQPSLTQTQKQLIAREFNLSETVFLHQQTPEDILARVARIDIFTPLAQIPFAGHPTIGTAAYLLHHLRLDSARVLRTGAGPVAFRDADVRADADAFLDRKSSTGSGGNGGSGSGGGASLAVAHKLHMHNNPFADTPYAQHPVVSIVNGMTAILARLPDLASLAAQTQNLVGAENTFAASARLDEGWRSGPVVTYYYVDEGTVAGGARRLRTRNLGSREDPATGSSASALCGFLTLSEEGAEEGEGPTVRRFEVVQGVEMGRRSEIRVQVALEDDDRTKVKEIRLEGNAVMIMQGRIPIPDVGLGVHS